jgi:pimeloyl-ACP methyl ester carboxylesterase
VTGLFFYKGLLIMIKVILLFSQTLFFGISIVLLFGSCETAMDKRTNDKKSIMIFIHGIKGSLLADEKENIVWLNGSQGLGISAPKLSLPMNWNGDIQEKDSIRSVGILSDVKVIPFLLEEKIYSPWLQSGKDLYSDQFYSFHYDWRRDNLESVSSFESFVDKIRKENTDANITVVAHSMGGLITLVLFNKRPELFQKIVFVGVPFYGGIGFLEDLHVGIPTGLNSKILTQEILFTMPSVYTLFPIETKDHIIAEDLSGTPIEIDFYSADAWKKNKFSVFANDTDSEKKFSFLEKALKKAKQFKEQIKFAKIKYPPILVVTGKSNPTLSKIQKNGKHSFKGWDFKSLAFEPGDGRVLEKNSFPPKGILYETFYSEATHSALLNDPKVVDRIREFTGK